MRGRLRHAITCALCVAALVSLYCIGAYAYTYSSNLPPNVSNLKVTIGGVTLPLSEYPDGSYFSPEKSTMTVAEQSKYGINVGGDLNLRGWECVGFARYVYAALFYKYPQDATIDNQLAYSSDYTSIYYRNVIKDTLGTNTLAGGYSASTLKTLISACQPGAVMRVGGHSMMIMAIYNDGLVVYDANFASDNEVDVRSYTWERFVESLGSRGISALQMPAYYPGYSYSTGGANESYPLDTAKAGNYLVYNCTKLNVRSAPTTGSSLVGTIASGATVTVKGAYNGWAQITFNGVDRWVYMDYLKATATELKVTFDPAGGSVSETTHTYKVGSTFASMPTPTRADCVFLGWYNGNTRYAVDSKVPVAENMTLTARWAVMGFEDVSPNSWYAQYVITACNYGLIMKDTKFMPNSNATRAQFVTVLAREYQRESGKSYDIGMLGSSIFTDLTPNEYYDKPIAWAYVNQITTGTSKTEFSPHTYVLREQIATFLYRYSKAIGVVTSDYNGASLIEKFKDSNMVSGYAKEAMNWAISIGLFAGDEQGRLNPQNPALRCEMVTIMSRYINYLTANFSGDFELKAVTEASEEEEDSALEDADQVPEADSTVEVPEDQAETVIPSEEPAASDEASASEAVIDSSVEPESSILDESNAA